MKTIKKYFDIKLLLIAIFSSLLSSFLIINLVTPAKLYPSGFSGISRFLTDFLFETFGFESNYSLIYFSLNIIACIFCYKYIGKKFTIYSFIQFSLTSLFIEVLPQVSLFSSMYDNLLLYVIFGGILNGISSGLCLRTGFSTGGIDFISVYYSNKHNKSFWNYAFAINVSILAIAGALYGLERCMYSIVYQYFSTTLIKQMHNRYTYKTLTIITKMPNEVSEEIMNHVRHGITEMKTEGYFSKTESTMLYTVVNSFQYREVIRIVNKIDPHAFINVQDTREIQGNYYQKPLD